MLVLERDGRLFDETTSQSAGLVCQIRATRSCNGDREWIREESEGFYGGYYSVASMA